MNKIICFALSTMLFALNVPTQAQQTKKIARIGYLAPGSRSSESSRIEVFSQALRNLDYVEGKNIVIEYRFAEGKFDRLPGLAAELVACNG